MLVGRPCDGFHSSRMVAKAQDGRVGVLVPDEELIVIAAARNLPIVWRPFQAANL